MQKRPTQRVDRGGMPRRDRAAEIEATQLLAEWLRRELAKPAHEQDGQSQQRFAMMLSQAGVARADQARLLSQGIRSLEILRRSPGTPGERVGKIPIASLARVRSRKAPPPAPRNTQPTAEQLRKHPLLACVSIRR